MSFGRVIDASVIEKGLRELNGDLNFDPASRFGAWHPQQATRQGVFWHTEHICSMDRGLVPEFKQWTVITRYVPVGWEEADKDDVSISTETIPPNSPSFLDAALHVMNRTVGYEYRPDGQIMVMRPMAYRKVQGRVALVGWRHTFERIIHRDLPGLTRSAIAAKFGVDMLVYAGVPRHELYQALIEE